MPFNKVDLDTLEFIPLSDEELANIHKPVKEEKKASDEEDQEAEESEEEPSLIWKEPEEGMTRDLHNAPFFSDGNYLYLIARYIPKKSE